MTHIVLSLGSSLALVLLWRGIRLIRVHGYQAQLAPFGTQQPGASDTRRFVGKILLWRPAAWWLADHLPWLRRLVDEARVERQLTYAGRCYGLTAHELYGIQLYYMLIGLLVGGLYGLLQLPFEIVPLIVLPLVGFWGPRGWLRHATRQRQQAITLALPDLLDMLAVCIAAGQGFEQALRLLVDHGEGPLYEEIRRVLDEQTVGEPHTGAFRRLAERNSSEPLRRFVDALLQSEALGTSIAATLEQQAEDMRVFRRHQARTRGAQAATKISLVVVVAVVPSVMCLMVGAVALSIWESARSVFAS
jgi:tight adherence protein C